MASVIPRGKNAGSPVTEERNEGVKTERDRAKGLLHPLRRVTNSRVLRWLVDVLRAANTGCGKEAYDAIGDLRLPAERICDRCDTQANSKEGWTATIREALMKKKEGRAYYHTRLDLDNIRIATSSNSEFYSRSVQCFTTWLFISTTRYSLV